MSTMSLAKVTVFWFCLIAMPGVAFSESNDAWQFGAAIYGWFPDIEGTTAFLDDADGGDFEIEVGDILGNLEFAFLGSFEAKKGQWGVATDVVYMSVSKSDSEFREGFLSGTRIPVDVTVDYEFDSESLIWTTAGFYRMVEEQSKSFDLLAGVRYLDAKQELDWSASGNIGQIPLPGREGNSKERLKNWDFVVGMRGRFAFGPDSAWFIPYYLDLGTGDSDFTWQAAAGLGYSFKWGELGAIWRHLDYELDVDEAIADLSISGPALGIVFRW